jgi:hypothetical protein
LYNYLSDNLGDAQWARPKPMVTRNVRIEARSDVQRANRSSR